MEFRKSKRICSEFIYISFFFQDGEYERVGEPTEAALRVLVEKLGIDSSANFFLNIRLHRFSYFVNAFIGRADTDESTFEGEVSILTTAYQTIGITNAKQTLKGSCSGCE